MVDGEVRFFLRAAERRFEAAKALLDPKLHGAFGADSAYLGGYVVECVLKALLLSRTPSAQRSREFREFRGAGWHDFERLRERVARTGIQLPVLLAADFRRVGTWSTEARYASRRIPHAEAEPFLASVERISSTIHRVYLSGG